MTRTRSSIAFLLLAFGVCLPAVSLALTEQEQRARIALGAARLDEVITNSGSIVDDPRLTAYLQAILDKLFPERQGTLHVHVIRDADFNAFAVPSGSIYFNTGALLRIQDEAQLACVLAHEGSHVTGDHGYRGTLATKTAITGMLIGSMVVPLLPDLVAVTSLAGYSRELESEADTKGFERLVKAGYSPQAPGETFARLDRELTAAKLPRHYFWADHPSVTRRIENFTKLMGTHPEPGVRNADTYLLAAQDARMDALRGLHRQQNSKVLVFLLADEQLLSALPPEARFYLAEGYRLRDQKGDLDLALAEYRRLTQELPQFAPPFEALGVAALRAGRRGEALEFLQKFVVLETDASRSAYARQYIDQLSKESK